MWQRLIGKGGNDIGWIKSCHEWFPVLMKRHDEIFTQKDLKDTYQENAPNGYYSHGGIHSLVTCQTGNPVLTKNIQRVGKEEGLIK
jgi:hypothetical protein